MPFVLSQYFVVGNSVLKQQTNFGRMFRLKIAFQEKDSQMELKSDGHVKCLGPNWIYFVYARQLCYCRNLLGKGKTAMMVAEECKRMPRV